VSDQEETRKTARKWRRLGWSWGEIAKRLGMSVKEARRVARNPDGGRAAPNEYLIQLEASAIRLTWNKEDEYRRRVVKGEEGVELQKFSDIRLGGSHHDNGWEMT
jgi:hypothetical protein